MNKKIITSSILGLVLVQSLAFGWTNPFSSGSGTASDGVETITGSSVSDLTGSLTGDSGVTKSVEEIINSMSGLTDGLDDLFPTDNIKGITDQVSGLSSLAGCFGQSMPDMDGLSGICGGLGNLGIGGLGGSTSSMLACVGMKSGDLGSLGTDLSSICNGIGKGSGTGSSTPGHGGVGSGSTTIPKGVGYNSKTSIVTESADASAAGDGTSENKPKKSKDIKYPSGLSGEDVANYPAKKHKDEPSSASAKNWLRLNTASLVLEELSLKSVGDNAEVGLTLPATKAESIDEENSLAAIQASTAVNHYYQRTALANKAIKEYKNIEASTVSDYRVKETAMFSEKIRKSKEVTDLFEREKKLVDFKYASILFLEKGKPDYIFDPSEERAKWITPEKKNEYVFASLLQKSKMLLIKSEAAKEKKIRREIIDITIQRAYYTSSVFPAGVAEEEINQLLKAVDTAIK